MQANFAVFIFGFVSGFILLISGNTLNFWLSASHINIESIGLFSLASAPYALCFLWAPILDKVKIPVISKLFGHRFSWIYILQILLAISVFLVSLCKPEENLYLLAILSFIVALLGSTQDTAIGALRSEIIKASDQGSVSGTYIFGYRVGMLISGSVAILLSSFISFTYLYRIFAIIIMTFPLLIHYSTLGTNLISQHKTKKMDFSFDLLSIGSWKFTLYLIIFLILYRLPDNFINVMMNPFLLEKGFKTVEIATIGKFLGTISAILGGFLASIIMKKHSILSSLTIFGLIHGVAHLMFAIQNIAGHNISMLFLSIWFESITGGATMACYMAFITSLCHGTYRATQYAFLTSMMGLSRSILPSFAGFFVESYGWSNFYLFTSIAVIPSICILLSMKRRYNLT